MSAEATKSIVVKHLEIKLSEKDKARFLSKSKVDEVTGCHVWQEHRTHNGYGRFWLKGKNVFAHRISYVLKHGSIDEGMSVLHNCPCGDNPACTNPDHLSLGTHDDNMRHMAERGRAATGLRNGKYTKPESRLIGDKNPARLHPEKMPRGDNHYSRRTPEKALRGSRHGQAKVNEEIVAAMRAEYYSSRISASKLGERYGLSNCTACSIVNGETWKHVPMPAPPPTT